MSSEIYEITRRIGKVADRDDAAELNVVSWFGNPEKYDIGKWKKNGTSRNGMALSDEELLSLLDLLETAVEAEIPDEPIYVKTIGAGEAQIYADFGTFGTRWKDNKKWNKKVTYTDWGYGCKIDLREWDTNFSKCNFGTGVTLNEDECMSLIDIIKEELCIEGTDTEDDYYVLEPVDIVVRCDVSRCNKNHEVFPIRAEVPVVKKEGEIETVGVPAGYCKDCNCYFILNKDFADLQRIGTPICKLYEEDVFRKNGDKILKGYWREEESIYSRIGYSVSAKAGLSSEQRQTILVFAVENGIGSIIDVCNFIDSQIRNKSTITFSDMSKAIAKWTEDREYIASYKLGTRKAVKVSSIKRKNYR